MVSEKHSCSRIFVQVERMTAHYYKMLTLHFLIVLLFFLAVSLENINFINIFHISLF